MSEHADVCALGDIANGRHRAFEVLGLSIIIFRLDREVYAVENRCSHLGLPLEGGRQIGCEIICRAHGARFDIRSGKVLGGPAVDPIRRFEARIRDGRVEVKV